MYGYVICASLQGHFKVVKYLVDHVSQFPSDSELTRYIGTLSDKVRKHNASTVRVYTSVHDYVHVGTE